MNKNILCNTLTAVITLTFLAVSCPTQGTQLPIIVTSSPVSVTESDAVKTSQHILTPRPVTRLAALIEGKLTFENGCLRVGPNGKPRYLLVWPAEYATAIKGDWVEVTTGQFGGDKQLIKLRIGSSVRLGGGNISVNNLEPYLRKQIPSQCSDNSVWVVGTIYS